MDVMSLTQGVRGTPLVHAAAACVGRWYNWCLPCVLAYFADTAAVGCACALSPWQLTADLLPENLEYLDNSIRQPGAPLHIQERALLHEAHQLTPRLVGCAAYLRGS